MTTLLPRPRRATGAALALAAVLAAGACAAHSEVPSATPGSSSTPSSTPSSASSTPAPTGATVSARSHVPGPSGTVPSAPRALRPVHLTIPAIGVDASMTDLGIGRGGEIDVPSDPDQAGWLDTTPAPGQQGPAVIAGHVDSTSGPAVFYRLSSLRVGDPVTVTRRNGSRVTFTVDGVRVYAKRTFPTADVYGPAPGPVLRLITCGGDYVRDHGGYQSNVVVYAS